MARIGHSSHGDSRGCGLQQSEDSARREKRELCPETVYCGTSDANL